MRKFRAIWPKLKEARYFEQGEYFIDTKQDGIVLPFAQKEGNKSIYLGKCEISQFTGLLDKNGVEIYEGDIIQREIETESGEKRLLAKGEVVFHFGGFAMAHGGIFYPMSRQHGVCIVIGNVFQNPELLDK
jgi:uncharacterized phage protein (TIGR01671 family)